MEISNMKSNLKSIVGKELSQVIKVGKRSTCVGLQTAGNVFSGGRAEIFLECYGNSENCHDTIAITPNNTLGKSHMTGNEIVDSITDKQAGQIFEEEGWLVKGYNNPNHTRCPECKEEVK